MRKSSKKTVNISREIAPILNSRDVIRELFPAARKIKNKSLILDFKNVRFISRSAAHELVTLKERLAKNRDIDFINLESEVENMIRLIASNRVAPKKKKVDFDVERVSIEALC